MYRYRYNTSVGIILLFEPILRIMRNKRDVRLLYMIPIEL